MSTATLTQFFNIGLGEEVFEGKFETDQERDAVVQDALDAASTFVEPLSGYGLDIVRAECIVAAYDLMVVRGYNPSFNDDELFKRYEEIARMVRLALQGKIEQALKDGTVPGASPGTARAKSEEKRGW